MFREWCGAYRRDHENAFPGKGRLKPHEQRIKELDEKVKRLEMERDILKKATAYFAREPH